MPSVSDTTIIGNMIYLDILFLLNWTIDYLILALIKHDFFPETKKRRIVAGAFLAAGTYLFWLFQEEKISKEIRMAEAACFMSLVLLWTFPIRRWNLFCKTAATAFGYILLMGGFCHVLQNIFADSPELFSEPWWVPLVCAAVFLFLKKIGKRIKNETVKIKECTYEVEIRRKDRAVKLMGLYDSGNLLVSQWTGKGICVLSFRESAELFDEKEKEILSFLIAQKDFPWKIMTENLWSGICRITYSSVGKEKGWMPGIAADHIIVKKDGEVLVDTKGLMGITAQNIFQDRRFAVLLPADIFTKQTSAPGPFKKS